MGAQHDDNGLDPAPQGKHSEAGDIQGTNFGHGWEKVVGCNVQTPGCNCAGLDCARNGLVTKTWEMVERAKGNRRKVQ